jgi:hypothetical protein
MLQHSYSAFSIDKQKEPEYQVLQDQSQWSENIYQEELATGLDQVW